MVQVNIKKYSQTYAIPPGIILQEWLSENMMPTLALVEKLQKTPNEIEDIVRGKTLWTTALCEQLEHLTAIPSHAWMRTEKSYRKQLAKIAQEKISPYMLDVPLQLKNLDFDDDAVISAIMKKFNNVSLFQTHGISVITMFAETKDPYIEIIDFVTEFKKVALEVGFVHIYPDIVTLDMIARRASPFDTVPSFWKDILPEPISVIHVGSDIDEKVWEWATIVDWLETTQGYDMDEPLPDKILTARVNAYLAEFF